LSPGNKFAHPPANPQVQKRKKAVRKESPTEQKLNFEQKVIKGEEES